MTQIFVVEAFGGRYEDAWSQNLAAFRTEQAAQDFVVKLEHDLNEIRTMELPEAVAGHDVDWDDERQIELHEEALTEFKRVVMDDLNIPEFMHEWFFENWDASYDCDRPDYRVIVLHLVD